MNSKQIQYVLTLAYERSFSKAAEALNITQPSLSQYIKKIEKEVGLPLFDRTNGIVRLTDAGRIFVEAGRAIIDLEHRMEVSFSDLAANKTGSLIIGAAPYRAASMLPEIAKKFQAIHPGMHLQVREGTTAELAEEMSHGEYDLALTLLPIDDKMFTWEKVTEEELILAVPAAFPVFPAAAVPHRKYRAVEPQVLQGQRMVMLTETQYMQQQLRALIRDHGVTVQTAVIVKSLEAQIEMVKAGVGMALMPSGIERFCGPGEVRFYSFAQPLPQRELVVMWRRDRPLSKAAEALKAVIHSIAW